MTSLLKINCIKVIQNEIEFFIGKVKAKYLFDIVDITNRVILNYDEKGLPIYNDKIQRKPNQTRVNAIRDYLLNDESATFPNNIIVALPSEIILNDITSNNDIYEINIDKSKIIKSNDDTSVYMQIIDGQHRFKGIKEAVSTLRNDFTENKGIANQTQSKLDDLLNFEFVVSFFIDPEIDFQAMIFSTINRTPVRVSPDLVYDLFGLLDKDSPQKTSLAITLELNAYKTKDNKPGPFFKRIKMLGKKSKDEDSYLSQGTFIRTLVTLISPSIRLSENERFLKREDFNNLQFPRTIFRKYYADNKDNLITKILISYFSAVRDVFIDANGNSYWDFKSPDNVFQRTIGFSALIDILIELYPIGLQNKSLKKEFFVNYLTKASNLKILNEDGNSNYPYSSAGKNSLRDDLRNLIFEK